MYCVRVPLVPTILSIFIVFIPDIPDCGGIALISLLNRTNLLAIVGNGRHMRYPRNKGKYVII